MERIVQELIKRKAWIISADMGYGHQRAVYPLREIAEGGVITVGNSDATSPQEKILWDRLLSVYETLSRASGVPVLGKPVFSVLEALLHIPSYYPIRNLSTSTFQVHLLASLIGKGLCAGVLEKIRTNHLPVVTSFYAPAIAADMNGYDRVYCIICDADLNRVWVAKEPWESRINYFAPCGKAAQRLQAYGVPRERIFLTGFPLPQELLGGRELTTLKADIGQRLHYLDPENRFWPYHCRDVEYFLGAENCEFKKDRVLTLTFAVGGAGAQMEIGASIALSLKLRLLKGEARLNLVAGTKETVRDFFQSVKERINPACENIRIVFADTMDEYFRQFNNVLHETDILWTKPSELSFYAGLGIPIIISPAIGSQEHFNRKWLREIQAGMKQENPEYTDQWLFDALNNGRLAEMAWAGFLKARKLGTYKIMEILEQGKMSDENSPLLR